MNAASRSSLGSDVYIDSIWPVSEKTDLELHSSKPTLSGKHKVHVLTYIKVKYYFQLYKTHY